MRDRSRIAAVRVFQRAALGFASLTVALAMAEALLAIDGRYNGLASRRLVGSAAIWEPPASTIEYESHPDLGTTIEIRYDAQGVRNHSSVPTEQKHHIAGFFGDSFTENRGIEDRFSFTSLLNEAAAGRISVVNYGVAGYGVDQAYLRYRKYSAHDIAHVVYVFCENDLLNLAQTGLVERTGAGEIVFRDPGSRPVRRLLGRLRLTYLITMGFAALRHEPEPDWAKESHANRSNAPITEDDELRSLFAAVLDRWRREVEAAGRTFTVVVLPRREDTELAADILAAFTGRVIYLRDAFGDEVPRFANDPHWNEYGNLVAANALMHAELPFHAAIANETSGDKWKARIDEYYQVVPR